MSDVFSPNLYAAFYFETSGRLKLTVLSEDRLQMKWKEADGPVQGYKVRVRPISGEATAQTPVALPSTWWFHKFTKSTPALWKGNTLKRPVSDFMYSLIERCSVERLEETQEGNSQGLFHASCVSDTDSVAVWQQPNWKNSFLQSRSHDLGV